MPRPVRALYPLLVLALALITCGNPPATTPLPPANVQAPPASPSATPTINIEQVKTGLDSLVPAAMQANNSSGCSLAIAYPDAATGQLQTVFFNYGTLSKGSKAPVDSTSEYEIGSLSKLFTADLLAQFVLDGSMQLEDPVQKYLPSSVHAPTYNGQVITLRELATHTSGLPRTLPNSTAPHKVNGVQVSGYVTDEDIFNFLNSYQLTRPPGAKWEYSNLAFAVLGIAEEQVSNDSYENLMLNRIAGPLALADTRAVLSAQQKARLAQGYSAQGTNASPFAEQSEFLAAGGLRSTAQDMAVYLLANMQPERTKLAALLQMTLQKHDKGGSPTGAMGLGWNITDAGKPQEQFNKAGSTAGYNSYIAFWPGTHIGYVLLCNGHPVSDLSPKISQLLGGSGAPVDGSE